MFNILPLGRLLEAEIGVRRLTEKLGYAVNDLGVASNAQFALFRLGSCQNPGGINMDERECGFPGYITDTHVTMEAGRG